MAYLTEKEHPPIDERITEAIKPSMPPEFAELDEKKKRILDELKEADPTKQAALRGELVRTSVRTIQLHKGATPDNYRSGLVEEVAGRSGRLLPNRHTGRLVKEYPSTDEASAK